MNKNNEVAQEILSIRNACVNDVVDLRRANDSCSGSRSYRGYCVGDCGVVIIKARNSREVMEYIAGCQLGIIQRNEALSKLTGYPIYKNERVWVMDTTKDGIDIKA